MIVVLLKEIAEVATFLYKQIKESGVNFADIKWPWKKTQPTPLPPANPAPPGSPIINIVGTTALMNVPVFQPVLPSVTVFVPAVPAFTIPANTTGMTGTEFGNAILKLAPDQTREDAIYDACLKGNLPDFMRNGQPVTVTVGTNKLTYWVLPDVLCIGTNDDYLRTPLNPLTAKKVGDLFGAALPTKKMSQQIWASAPVKLAPIPNGPPYDETMQTSATMIAHNTKIQKVLPSNAPGHIVTGHKKDVVYCTHLLQDSSRVAIYGWFYPTGQAIQGLNPVSHDKLYKDYSHGIRMVNRSMLLNGTVIDYFDLLKDPAHTSLISDEGAYDASHIYIV